MTFTITKPILEEKKYELEEIFQWLNEQASLMQMHITLYTDEAEMKGPYLYLPVYIREARDAYDYAVKSQALEDSWNDRQPRPNPPINLTPEKSPEQRALWERLWLAQERKEEAANLVAGAADEIEQQTALVKLRAARNDELQAEKEYNMFYGLDKAA